MPILRRYLAVQVLLPALLALAVLTVVGLVYYANRFLAEAVSEQLPMARVAAMTLLKLGILMDTLIPAATALGVAIGLGRLQARRELIATAALGHDRSSLLTALLLPVLLLSLATAALANGFRPWAYQSLYQLQVQTRAELGLAKVQPGRFETVARDWVVFAGSRDGDRLGEIMVHRRFSGWELLLRGDRMTESIEADGSRRLLLDGDVRVYRLHDRGQREAIGRFQRFSLDYLPPAVPERTRLRRAEPFSLLWRSDDPYHRAELQWRLIAPLSALVLAMAAFLMARIDPRRGQAMRIVSISLVVVLWFSLLSVLINWIEARLWPTWPGALALPIVAAALATLRLRQLDRQPGPLP